MHFGERADPAARRARYLREVAREANILPWNVVNPHFADPDQAEPLRLAEIYTGLDTTELRAVRQEEELRAFLARMDKAERVPAQEAIDRHQRLLILGDPGSGKSTLVKHLAYALATAGLAADPAPALAAIEPWRHGALLPVVVELRYLAEHVAGRPVAAGSAALLGYLQANLAERGLDDCWPTVQAAVEAERPAVLFLLDGLDEMGGGQRQQVVDAVNHLCEQYSQHRFVVTCRPYAYVGQPWQLARFSEVTLAPFSREQIDGFVANWYRRLAERGRFTAQEANRHRDALQQALRRGDLQGLAERPLLLTVMAQLHTFSGRLPDDRTELYADAVRLLLQRWESRVGQAASLLQTLDVPGLKLSDLEAGLYRVAFNAHAGAGDAAAATADIPEGELRGWLAPYLGGSYDKAGLFVDYIRERAGLLYRHKPAAYTFPHRTFQEFLAACELAGRPDYPGEAARLVREDLNRWGEVFVLAAGHAARTHRLSQAVAAVNALCPHAVGGAGTHNAQVWRWADVAGQALLEIGGVAVQREEAGRAALARVQGWLAAGLGAGGLPAPQRAQQGRTLGRLGDPRPEVMTVAGMHFCHVPAGPFTMGEGKEKDAREHENTVNYDYWISRYPVTNAQFRQFVEAQGYQNSAYWAEASDAGRWQQGQVKRTRVVEEAGNLGVQEEWAEEPYDYGLPFNLPNHPVVGVTWYEAVAFCRWLGEHGRTQGWLPAGLAVGLPNEPEWEKAARGGREVAQTPLIRALTELPAQPEVQRVKNPDSRRTYPWAGDFDADRANVSEAQIGSTSAVGCFAHGASPYGAEEMAGNAWEWTRSLWGKGISKPDHGYPYVAGDGRENPAAGRDVLRVVRGGAFGSVRDSGRCAARVRSLPLNVNWNGGFRVELSPYPGF